MTLDYNGTTIIQQTPFVNMWNSFKLMTSLSLNDVSTQGATIGFYPDDPTSWGFYSASSATVAGVTAPTSAIDTYSGQGVVNNTNYVGTSPAVSGQFYSYNSMLGNMGYAQRQQLINYDTSAVTGTGNTASTSGALATGGTDDTYAKFLTTSGCNLLWKSYISNKKSEVYAMNATAGPSTGTPGIIQFSIVATIYLKHLHSFFNMCPLLKGVFMKLTLNLNNTSSTIRISRDQNTASTALALSGMQCSSVSNPLGGVNPVMVASGITSNGAVQLLTVPATVTTDSTTGAHQILYSYIANISVGATCLDQTLTSYGSSVIAQGALSKSVYLYVPAMTFNPTFEQAYLSNSVKQIKYTDIYQYQVTNVTGGGQSTFNNLITNGIANIKSVLVLPFLSSSTSAGTVYSTRFGHSNNDNSGFISGVPVFQSPFDPAGTGCTSPLCHITNFNVQISGQNAIYNTQKYSYEQFNNQLYGQNAVNGGLTDGITSGLIDRLGFDMEYCYYYVNVERMLPVEMSVPKSVQILGTIASVKAVDLYVFVEYGVEIQIDALTGSRV